MKLYGNKFISICNEGEHGIYPILDSEGKFLTNIYTEENIEDHINDFKKCEDSLEATLEVLEDYEDFIVVDKVEEINEFVNKVGNKYLLIQEQRGGLNIEGHLTCKKCGYKQWDENTCLNYKLKFPNMELEDIPYTCGACMDTDITIPTEMSKMEFIEIAKENGFTEWAAEEIYDCLQAEYEFNGLALPFIPEDWEEININPTDDELESMRNGYKTIVHRTCVGTIVKGSIRLNVRDWYMENYPDDDLGQNINPDITFKDVYEHLENFYNIVEVGDSVIRERIFEKLAELTVQSYDKIYKIWLGKEN